MNYASFFIAEYKLNKRATRASLIFWSAVSFLIEFISFHAITWISPFPETLGFYEYVSVFYGF